MPEVETGAGQRLSESWEIPNAAEVYHVLAGGELLPRWWKGVYLEAHKLGDNPEPKVGDRQRVRRARLPNTPFRPFHTD